METEVYIGFVYTTVAVFIAKINKKIFFCFIKLELTEKAL